MRRALFALAVWLALALPTHAQIIPPTQTITVIDSGTACVTAPTACARWAVNNYPTVLMQITGTWTGTVTFEATADGQTWFAVLTVNQGTGAIGSTATANGQFAVANTGIVGFRARATGAITGGANITVTRGLSSLARVISTGAGTGATNTFSAQQTFSAGGLFGDGTAIAPSIAFASEPTLGFWRPSAALVTLQGNLTTTASVFGTTTVRAGTLFQGNGTGTSLNLNVANGIATLLNNGSTIGSEFKVDALPTVSVCGAGSPAVVAGSTPFWGAVTIGTTAVATCLITFNGTAFPSAPHCSGAVESTTAANVRAMGYLATTTTLTIVPSAAWADSSVVNWSCVSSK